MNRFVLSTLFTAISVTRALAQTEGAATAGAVMGGIIGLIITIVIGAVVGWVASMIVKGGGSGLLGDILFGIGGSILAGWVLPLLGVSFGGSMLGGFIAAVIGAVVLILLVRFLRRST